MPQDRASIAGSYTWRSGSIERYFRRGFIAGVTDLDYSETIGVAADAILLPPDGTTLSFGGLLALDSVERFAKVQGFDTLNFVQDISIGSTAELRLGLNLVDEDNTQDPLIEPTVALVLSKNVNVLENTYLQYSFAVDAVFEEEGGRPWSVGTTFKAYNTSIKNNTLALRVDYANGEDGNDLPVQLTLGENNGLRGYESRFFAGRQRVRINLESRYRPGWKVSVLDIGLVSFFDAGWAVARNDTSPTIRRSVGVGLRLGSNALLGSRVIRMDVAFPLDAPQNTSSDPTFSVAVGQVFRF